MQNNDELTQAKEAFVNMATRPFSPNLVELINNQFAQANGSSQNDSSQCSEYIYHLILLETFTQNFLAGVNSMINQSRKDHQIALPTIHGHPKPSKDKQSNVNNTAQYVRAVIEHRLGIADNTLFDFLLDQSTQVENQDLIKLFITFYYTDEAIRVASLKLSKLQNQRLEALGFINSEKGKWKRTEELTQRQIRTLAYYRQPYWAFGWLLEEPTNDIEDVDHELRNLCWGKFPEDDQYGHYGNLLDLVRDRYSAWIKDSEDTASYIKDHDIDAIIKTIVEHKQDEGALGRFTNDMASASSGLFGTWVLDTTFAPRDSNGEIPSAIKNLEQLIADDDTLYPNKLDDSKIRRIFNKLFNCVYKEDSGYQRLVPRDKSLPNPRFMFLFENWGGGLTPSYPDWGFGEPICYKRVGEENPPSFLCSHHTPYYGDFSGPLFGSITEDSTWTPPRSTGGQSSRAIWRDSKYHDTHEADNIGRFASATYDTPLWGAYMTDYVKGIHTPDITRLQKVIKQGDRGKTDPIYNAMNMILIQELGILSKALKQGQQINQQPILLMTNTSYEQIKNANLVEPWRAIRWPHHSGSGSGTFKVITLAYAYGRIERALQHIDEEQYKQADSHHLWQWPFRAIVGNKGEIRWADKDIEVSGITSPTLYEWLTDGFSNAILKHEYKYPFLADDRYKDSKHPRAGKGSAMEEAKAYAVKDAIEAFQVDVRVKQILDMSFGSLFKNNGSESQRSEWEMIEQILTPVLKKELTDKLTSSINAACNKAIAAAFDKEDCDEVSLDAAFLMGWREEDTLLPKSIDSHNDEHEKRQDTEPEFDMTLLPDVSSTKKELRDNPVYAGGVK